jgi:hypothetical protein
MCGQFAHARVALSRIFAKTSAMQADCSAGASGSHKIEKRLTGMAHKTVISRSPQGFYQASAKAIAASLSTLTIGASRYSLECSTVWTL